VRIIISVSFLIGVPQKEAALRRGKNRSAAIVHPDDDPSRLGGKGSSFAPRILCLLSRFGVRRRRGFVIHARACLGAVNVWRLS
jgi:hypothetical protein